MIESQMFMAVTSLIATAIAAGFAWLWRVVAGQKERDARIDEQLREIRNLQIETERTLLAMREREGPVVQDDETRDRWIEGRFGHVLETLREISGQLAPDAASRERVRRELRFIAKRMVKLERAAPIHVRCDPSEARDGEVRCPYCHGDLGSVDLVHCSRCQARQHRECHQTHGSCAVFGCGSTETGGAESVDHADEAARLFDERAREQRRARGA